MVFVTPTDPTAPKKGGRHLHDPLPRGHEAVAQVAVLVKAHGSPARKREPDGDAGW